jgi:glycosyltransferase involved in cell wall biosynthesis
MNNGVSFLVRTHNEEQTIAKSITSLDKLKIHYEIIVVLHRCTDSSEAIVKQLKKEGRPISIHYYHNPVSKAGYETVCTDENSIYSLPHYLNWCLSHCCMKWKFKWDSDFIMTDGLAEYLNSSLFSNNNTAFRINAVNSTSSNGELYLTDSLLGYSKYIFWEVSNFNQASEICLDANKYIIHDSEIKNIKPYWEEKPWFYFMNTAESNHIRERYERLISEFGEEPKGLARASNPECNQRLSKIIHSNPDYINFYK